LKFINNDTMLISTGKIFKITHDELDCRTEFWTEVADARSMFLNWGGGVLQGGTMTLLHRVVFYGDHMQAIEDLATLMGTKVVLEGKALSQEPRVGWRLHRGATPGCGI
jgi:hypothetical protein